MILFPTGPVVAIAVHAWATFPHWSFLGIVGFYVGIGGLGALVGYPYAAWSRRRRFARYARWFREAANEREVRL